MSRNRKNLMIEEDVDEWLEKVKDNSDLSRSDMANHAIRKYATELYHDDPYVKRNWTEEGQDANGFLGKIKRGLFK